MGADFDGTIGFEWMRDTARPVASAAGCHGLAAPHASVFDLSGNAWEWQDACSAGLGPDSPCLMRGGSFSGDERQLTCDYIDALIERSRTFWDIGFRCCRD